MSYIVDRQVLSNLSIEEYFGDKKHEIGMYIQDALNQRGYEWEEIKVIQLLNDIYDERIRLINKSSLVSNFYLLGSIDIYDDNGKSCIDDGSQRTVTLLLLLSYLYRQLKEFENSTVNELNKKKADGLSSDLRHIFKKDHNYLYHNKIQTDDPIYKQILDGLVNTESPVIDSKDFGSSYRPIFNAYEEIQSFVTDKFPIVNDDNIDEFINFINLYWSRTLVDVRTYQHMLDVERIKKFETQNERGQETSKWVKLRNNFTKELMVSGCNLKNVSPQFNEIRHEIDKCNHREIKFDKVLYWSALVVFNEAFKQKSIHDDLMKYIKTKYPNKDDKENAIINFLISTAKFVRLLNSVYSFNIEDIVGLGCTRAEMIQIKNFIKCITLHNMSYSNHFFLKVFTKYKDDPKFLIQLLNSFNNMILKSSKYGNGQAIQTKVNAALRVSYKNMDKGNYTIEDFEEDIFSKNLEQFMFIPHIVTTLVNICYDEDTDKRDANSIRSLLLRLEMVNNKYEPQLASYTDNKVLEIEHIFPQSSEIEDAVEIGNLTLLECEKNQSAGVLDFQQKRSRYDRSNYYNTREIGKLNNFTIDDIHERTATLFVNLIDIIARTSEEKNKYIDEFNKHLQVKISLL